MCISKIIAIWEVIFHSLFTGIPCRIVVTRHGCSYRGYVQTIKALTGIVQFESLLEKGAIEWFAIDARVVQIVAQPGPFILEDGSSYTPDFLLRLCDGSLVLIEVKWTTDLHRKKTMRKLQAAKLFFAQVGIAFHILTENDIRHPVLRHNVKLLRKVAHIDIPVPIIGTLNRALREESPLPVAGLAARINSTQLVHAAIARGLLQIDLLAPLTDNTPVCLGSAS